MNHYRSGIGTLHCTIQSRSNQFTNWIEFVEQPTRKNIKIKLNNVTINTAFLISVGWHDDNFTVLDLGFRFVDRNNSVQIPPKKTKKIEQILDWRRCGF